VPQIKLSTETPHTDSGPINGSSDPGFENLNLLVRISIHTQFGITPWPWSASELYRPSDRRLSGKLVSILTDRKCRVVSAKNPHSRILGFLYRSRYYFFQAASQLYWRGWVDPVPDPLLLRKSGSAGNQTLDLRICSQELWPLDHREKIKWQVTKAQKLSNLRLPL
jgi:hypothetical protein